MKNQELVDSLITQKRPVSKKKPLFIIGISLVLILTLLESTGLSSPLKSAVYSLFSPVGQGFNGISDFSNRLVGRFGRLSKLETENKNLKEEVARLLVENSALTNRQKDLELLADEAKVSGVDAVSDKLFANVVGREPESFIQYLRLDKGKKDGLSDGLAVTYKGVLIGRIAGTLETESRALVISAHGSVAQVRHENSRTTAIAKGGIDGLKIKNYPKESPLEPGDRIVTSGLDGKMPAGLLVGTVDKITSGENDFFKEATLRQPILESNVEAVIIYIK